MGLGTIGIFMAGHMELMGPPRMNIIHIWVYLLAVLVDCNELVPNTVSPRLAGPGRAPHGATSPEVRVVWVGSATGEVELCITM